MFDAISSFIFMPQMYNVFVNDKLICFVENINKIEILPCSTTYKSNDKSDLYAVYEAFIHNPQQLHLYVICNKNVEKFFKEFCSFFIFIEAAGGLVKNSKEEILFIFRRKKWDLPKGKMEKGESPEITAIREVQEETGLSELIIIKPLPSTYHIYDEGNRTILKKTYWFEMLCKEENPTLKPQAEESIEDIQWIRKKETTSFLKNSYKNVQKLFSQIS